MSLLLNSNRFQYFFPFFFRWVWRSKGFSGSKLDSGSCVSFTFTVIIQTRMKEGKTGSGEGAAGPLYIIWIWILLRTMRYFYPYQRYLKLKTLSNKKHVSFRKCLCPLTVKKLHRTLFLLVKNCALDISKEIIWFSDLLLFQ